MELWPLNMLYVVLGIMGWEERDGWLPSKPDVPGEDGRVQEPPNLSSTPNLFGNSSKLVRSLRNHNFVLAISPLSPRNTERGNLLET